MNLWKDNRGQFDLEDIHPMAVVFGLFGALVGWYMVRVVTGTGGFAVSDAEYELGFIWKILIPLACGAAGFFLTNKMFND